MGEQVVDRARPDDPSLFPEERAASTGPVECLGMTFESEEARRAHFLKKLEEKLPELRKRPDFPLGSDGGPAADEDILRLSDPPYYTACPNPFLTEFVERLGRPYDPTVPYHRKPFASDVNEGKGGKIYKAHTYHTKVPHEAIARYILHYTKPGELVLDAFAGCGMTGVAASFCGAPDATFKTELENSDEKPFWGARRAVLVDLSPFATFLAYNMTYPWTSSEFSESACALVQSVEDELPPDVYGRPSVSYYLWSQVFLCPECTEEIVFGEAAITEDGSISSTFNCPSCDSTVTKSKCGNRHHAYFDDLLGVSVTQNDYRPVSIARIGRATLEPVEKNDRSALSWDIKQLPLDVPVVPMMFRGASWGDMHRAGYHYGVSHVHHFWTRRNLAVLAAMWRKAGGTKYSNQMRFLLTSFMVKTGSRMHNIGMKAGKVNLAGQIFNTLQIPSLFAERNLFELAKRKIGDLAPVFGMVKAAGDVITSTASADAIGIPDNCVDYVFVDPPFGSNIMYAEMSFLYEAWLGVHTKQSLDTIVSASQRKDLDWYREQMARCFGEVHRVLKPGRWLTVAFHNSRNDVWTGLQEALQRAGFVVADVRILDKGQGTYKQMTTAGAVEKDLAISAYKPNFGLEERFKLEAGTEEGVWDFVRTHMRQLPVFVSKDGQAEAIAERQSFLLFDRMVAFHVQRGVTIPVSAAEFYAGLAQRFSERDGMYFLSEQAAEYDRKRMTVKEVLQLDLFVKDEQSAIQWLKQQLTKKPQTFQEVHPQFIKELGGWEKHEKSLELLDLLQENLLRYDGSGEVPSQIHGYLSSNFKELRSLEKDDPTLRAKAKDRWYVPDPRKAIDLERLRERSLLREFEEYRDGTHKKLKIFRLEAVRAGFRRAWQDRDYATIVAVARRIPDNVLQEDQKLLQWFDLAVTRSGEEV